MKQVPISARDWLREDAAASYVRMRAAGCPGGGITDAGRTYEEQAEMWRRYLAGLLKATAARPGTSKHETGTALDLAGPTRDWVRAHGHRFGWIKDLVRNEPWHCEYRPERDLVRLGAEQVSNPIGGTAGIPSAPDVEQPAPIKPKPKEGDVKYVKNIDTGNWFRVSGTTWTQVEDPRDVEADAKLWGWVDLSTDECSRVHRQVKEAQEQMVAALAAALAPRSTEITGSTTTVTNPTRYH